MKIVVYDNSKGKAYKKTKRIFRSLLVEISNRHYIGNLPARIIKDLLCNVKRKVSKLSDILVLVEQIDGFHGWTGYHYGKPISKIKYEIFLKSNRYLCDW